MSSKTEIKINVQITDVANKCLTHIRIVTEAISLIAYCVKNFNETSFPPIDVDGLPVVLDDPNAVKVNPKAQTLQWVFKKGFEEFIVGLTESLIEMHRFVNYWQLSNETRTRSMSQNEIENRVEEIKAKPLSLPFPTLIKEIEVILKVQLPFRDELISVNRVRNCIVHRNNIVGQKDINDKENNCLKLIYRELIVLSEKEGKVIEVKKEDKEKGFVTNKIGFDVREKNVSFSIGELVVIDPTVFNNVSFMCIQFCHELLATAKRIGGMNP